MTQFQWCTPNCTCSTWSWSHRPLLNRHKWPTFHYLPMRCARVSETCEEKRKTKKNTHGKWNFQPCPKLHNWPTEKFTDDVDLGSEWKWNLLVNEKRTNYLIIDRSRKRIETHDLWWFIIIQMLMRMQKIRSLINDRFISKCHWHFSPVSSVVFDRSVIKTFLFA